MVVRSFVRRFRNEILAAWKVLARTLPAAKQMNAIALVDHVPEMLEQIADLAHEIAHGASPEKPLGMARIHALDRLHAGFDISAVVEELSMLRACILDVWERENHEGNRQELRALNLAIDQAVQISVVRYSEARDRTLAGIDRISMAALESRSLDDLLSRLLGVFVDTTSSVDVAAIFLREGDRLHLRATVGLDDERMKGFSLAIGEGFAGRVAVERKPIVLRSAYLDPSIRSDVIRNRRVRALYGLPLIHNDELIGVAHMGSIKADELSHDDRQFFSSMTARATIGIAHHLLREELAQSEIRHKELAVEAERSLAKLESLLAGSPVGIAFLDEQLRYLRINQALASLNGKPVEEHIGKTVAEVLPAFAPQLEPVLRNILATGEPLTNMPASTPHGRSVIANFFPVQNRADGIIGVGAVIIDVTEERAVEEALRAERTRLQSILDYSPASIWIKDPEGHIVLANRRMAAAIGHPGEDLVGRTSQDLFPEVGDQHTDHDQIVMREQRAIEVEEIVPTPDGVRTFLSIKFPIPGDPPLVGGIATEITERKRMEDDLRVAVRTREDILAIVSHDLRNPLGAIQLSVGLLMAQQDLEHRVRRHVELVHRSAVRMEALIEDLLDTANIRAGRLAVDAKREPLDSVLAEALELQQPLVHEKGLALERDSSEVAGLELECDRDRVLQLFGNLIGNAVKFCRAGDTITVSAHRDGDHVRFCIADTGPGIAAETLPHLFDAYKSGPGHAKQGAGLGLFISRGIVEGHGGRIWVESKPGDGARFYFTLPIAKPQISGHS